MRFALFGILIYAVCLAPVQTLVAQTPARHSEPAANRLAAKNQPAGSNSKPGSRSNISEATEFGWVPPEPKTTPDSQASYSFVKNDRNCACGEDCSCLHDIICEAGDCKKNYAVLLTAKWCVSCRRMYPIVEQLRKEGYIIYVFDVDQYPEVADAINPGSVPMLLFYDKGAETKRHVGVLSMGEMVKHLVKRGDQKDPEPEPEPEEDYSFR